MGQFEERQMCTCPVCSSCENCIEVVSYDSFYNETEVYYLCMLDVNPIKAVSIKCEISRKGFSPEREGYSPELINIMGIDSEWSCAYDSPRCVSPYESCNFYKKGDIEDRVWDETEKEKQDGEV